MRALRSTLVVVSVALALPATFACTLATTDEDACARAASTFASCGASLPLLSGGACVGLRRAIATCITENATTCDELATLFRRMDVCVDAVLDGGEPLVPPSDLPLPERATEAGAPADPDGVTGPRDGGASPGLPPPSDAGAPLRDAGPGDAGVTTGDATFPILQGTVALDASLRAETATLAAGTYMVSMTGSGDADLYVRRGTAPTTTLYDCRPFLPGSAETCTVTLTAPAILHVLVRGGGGSSSFVVLGRVRP